MGLNGLILCYEIIFIATQTLEYFLNLQPSKVITQASILISSQQVWIYNRPSGTPNFCKQVLVLKIVVAATCCYLPLEIIIWIYNRPGKVILQTSKLNTLDRARDTRKYLMIIFLISHRKHMLWPLIWTVPSRRFRWGVTIYFFYAELTKIILNYHQSRALLQ